jgi:hypothetical protein
MHPDGKRRKMNIKTLLKINLVIGSILSLYFSIKGSMNYGWFSCLLFTKVVSCNLIKWLMQIIVLVILFTLIFLGIEYGIKYLYESYLKKKPKEEGKVKELKEKVKELKTELKEKKTSAEKEGKIEEKPKKKVIKI